jgi:signal transduction histidine kinase/methyl-accepting chemotaxis protein
VNGLIDVLAMEITDTSRVLKAMADGDLTQRIDLRANAHPLRGDLLELGCRVNRLAEELSMFTAEAAQLADDAGMSKHPDTVATSPFPSSNWQNVMYAVNTMAGQLGGFVDEIACISRDICVDGNLDVRACHRGESGVWAELIDKINDIIAGFTAQLRDVSGGVAAVSQGDLSKKVDVGARGNLRETRDTVNATVDTLRLFVAEIMRVTQEVGREGRLGGQARVDGMQGVWRQMTASVNDLADSPTHQVRAMSEIASSVTHGDLSHEMTTKSRGEISQMETNVNLLVNDLREKEDTKRWLESNLSRLNATIRGNRDLAHVADLVLCQIAPLVDAQCGAFFLARTNCESEPCSRPANEVKKLSFVMGYGIKETNIDTHEAFAQDVIEQIAQGGRRVQIREVPADHLKLCSEFDEPPLVSVAIIPVLFEEDLLGVIELASHSRFSDTHLAFFDQFVNIFGTTINTILSKTCAAALLEESRQLEKQLQERSAELRRQQAELEDSKEELRKALPLASSSRHKSKFLANMSHELRTRLTSMLIYARLLADDTDSNLSIDEIGFATSIHQAGVDLLRLVDDILDLSKVEAGRLDIRLKKLPLASLVDYLTDIFWPVADDRGLDLEIQASDDLPAELYSDGHRLRQILGNLLSNAIKFTPSGQVRLTVEHTSGEQTPLPSRDDVIVFSVRDSGIGIPSDKLSLIFEAFEQVDYASSSKYGGTGLGLSICRELTMLLGGKITVESAPNAGSTFTLYIPTSGPCSGTSDSTEPRDDQADPAVRSSVDST